MIAIAMMPACFAGLSVLAVTMIVCVIVALVIWDAVWKLIAMWKSAQNDQPIWFVCLAIFNTVGILPILYIWLFQKKSPAKPV